MSILVLNMLPVQNKHTWRPTCTQCFEASPKEASPPPPRFRPSGEPSPPAVHGQRGMGKAYRLGLVKQDDGGMPIVEYIVKYKTVSLLHLFYLICSPEKSGSCFPF